MNVREYLISKQAKLDDLVQAYDKFTAAFEALPIPWRVWLLDSIQEHRIEEEVNSALAAQAGIE